MDDFVSSSDDRRTFAVPVHGFEDGAVYDADHNDEAETPIFSLGQVQFTLPSALFSLSCANNVLVLAVTGSAPSKSSAPASPTSHPQIIRIDLAQPTEVETIDIPLAQPQGHGRNTPTPTPPSLHKVHVDPSGRHVIVSTSSGENFYLYVGVLPANLPANVLSSRKTRPLPRLKGAIIDSVAWAPSSSSSPSSATSFSTREILLGTTTGQILETNLVDPALVSDGGGFSLPVPGRANSPERYVKQLLTLPERQPIVGLRYEIWNTRRLAVIAATTTKVYQYVGDGATLGNQQKHAREDEAGLLETVLHHYASGDLRPKMLELPSDSTHSELHFCSPSRTDGKEGLARPKSMAWLTGPGVYHGNLVFPPASTDLQPGDAVIDSASLIPYPLDSSGTFTAEEQPISMALTDHHFVLLYEDKICAVDILTDKVVFLETLDLPDGSRPVRLSTDVLRKTCWMHTETSIFELVIRDEDRDVWKVYLTRQNWELAKKSAKTQRQRDTVLAAEADAYFAAGRFIQAAQAYAQSSKGFEEVVLRFVDKHERDALRVYLVAKLEKLKKSDLTQRMMLATWLVELYLSKINHLEDLAAAERASEDADNLLVERTIVEEDMRNFLSSYKDNLDSRTTYELLERHARDELTLYFASLVGDHERIVRHHIAQQEWTKALQALARQDSPDLYYPFASILLKHAPKETVDSFMRQPQLDLRRLLPAMSTPRPRSSSKTTSAAQSHLIRYLEHVILDQHNTDTAVHNTLVTLYATSPSSDEAAFVRFLETAPADPHTGDPYYDLDYALRVSRAHKRVQACVVIYSKMALYESSVNLALEHDDLELAKICADKPEDDDLLRKKLWLKIAKHVVGQKNDIKTAMQFLESTSLLKIEDILPFFPDFVVIDDFKEEICSALEDYSAHIERLKEDMTEATRSAEAIKADIAELDNRFVIVEAGEKCGVCRQQLLTRQFYVFPCQHCFHADCLIQEVTKTLSPTQLRRMLDLQARLAPSAVARSETLASKSSSKRPLGILDDTSAQGLKLAAASVQAVDQLRKLVLPDALLSAIGGAIPLPAGGGAAITNTMRTLGGGLATPLGGGVGGGGGRSPRQNGSAEYTARREFTAREKRQEEEKEKLRKQLDDLIASECVLCEGAIDAIDRGFVEDGETM
ncbi:hypothetical protein JCM10908_000728 [Rhodotorula pacifica]|uniref:tethering complex subunit PEP3 n=1 Tax=Rhodotorula pacifica TaxID=1495444 RepID=UPI0031700EDD